MPLTHPIVRLLEEEPADRRRAVAFGEDRECSLGELRDAAFALATECATDRGRRWLVECEDAYRVAVVLLAAAMTGARIALPPNLQPATRRELREGAARVFGDRDGDGCSDPLRLAESSEDGDPPVVAIDRDAPLVELFTSGTSGPGKRIVKALRHLEDEAVELEHTIGEALALGAAILATVPVQHLYGLLFRVLWPLASGRAFARSSALLPEELIARIGELSRVIVVSSPAHLRHLAASARLSLATERVVETISSGGPLDTATALRLEQVLGCAPREVFGSTETGGVAWRRASRFDPSPPWQPFGPVDIATEDDGSLVVTSPFVTPPGEASAEQASFRTGELASFRMADRVELHGRGFRLLGRSDRVAKIGEKTLSLPEIEEFLSAHPLVREAAVATFRGSKSERLGALVVLEGDGRRELAAIGRRAMASLLSAHLAERWDRVALPRRWRFVDELPADERGKLSAERVGALLTAAVQPLREALRLDASSTPGDGEPQVGSGARADREAQDNHPADAPQQAARAELREEFVVPRDLAYLSGHYDAFPLVPGVVQVQWAIDALVRMLGRPISVRSMEALKFKSVLKPAQAFTMRIAADASASRATFSLEHEGRVFSSGRLRWTETET